MYRCIDCGAEFERPAVRRCSAVMPEGYRERCCYWVCPRCGASETEFEEVKEETNEE